MSIRHREGRRLALPLAGVVMVATGLITGTLHLDRSLRDSARARAGASLEAIATLKVAAIVTWRAEQESDLAFAASYPSVAEAVASAGRGEIDPALARHVRGILDDFARHQRVLRIALLGPTGLPLLEPVSRQATDVPVDPALLSRALTRPDRPCSALRAGPGNGELFLDVAGVVQVPGAAPAILVMRADARPIFHAVVDGWPVPSETATSGLVRRDGDTAVVHGTTGALAGAARPLRLRLDDLARPAVQAARGAVGRVEGLGYQGQAVLAAIAPLPDSDWRLVTRMEVGEIEAPVERPVAIIALLAAALVAAAVVVLALWWRQELARQRMEEALREGAERLRFALAGTHRVWDWDLAEGTLVIDREAPAPGDEPSATLRGTLAEILARTVHPDDLEAVGGLLEGHRRGATPHFEAEYRTRPDGGPLRWLHLRGRASLRDQAGLALRMTGVVADVTERRRLQAQLERSERMASLGTLAAGVAHEVNNPLASVLANLDHLGELLGPGAPPSAAELLADARDGAERVRDVVRGLRAFTSPGAGRSTVDVRAEMEAAVRLARHEVRHRARLEVVLGPLPPVTAGAHELGQVFLNLLVNAAQAMPEGHADDQLIAVSARTDEAGWAVISIRDTGAGIAPEVLDRIFEPFFTTKPQGLGTGLGLAIAHGLVAAAGGRIEVESHLGVGSIFRVHLPPAGAPVEAVAAPSAPPAGPAAAAAGPRLRVLVVDDDPLVAKAAARTLSRLHLVDVCGAATDALKRIEAGERYDAILCDLMMPQMTGMELHAALRRIDQELADRVVFITGGAFTDGAVAFLREVPNACVEKPFDPDQLREAVARVGRRQPADQPGASR